MRRAYYDDFHCSLLMCRIIETIPNRIVYANIINITQCNAFHKKSPPHIPLFFFYYYFCSMQKHLIYILFLCLWSACTPQTSTQSTQTLHYQTDSLLYATHFSIQRAENHTLLTLHNPWHAGQTLGKYYLVKHDSIATPTDGYKLVTPLNKVCIQSSPHIGYIDALQQTMRVIGACSPHLLYSPLAQKQYQQGKISHLGDAYQMHLEKIKQLSPQALLITAYPQGDNQTQRLQNGNIAIIPTTEWTEPNLLARAEWIKVYGLLFDCYDVADSLFMQTVGAYQQLTQLAQSDSHAPTIMSGLPYKDTWYMPGGNSFMGQLFKDANTSYHYQNTPETSSLPISFETAWYHFQDANIWVGIDADNTQQLLQMDKRLHNFKAVKNNQLFHYRKRTTPTGGNDFWESAVVFPHRLLHDLITVTHPNLLPYDSCFYIGPVL
jgi:iron complex transport system substrate-binding protein